MISEPWASSDAWPSQEKVREALPLSSGLQCGAWIPGRDNIGCCLQGSSVSLFLYWEIFCSYFENGSKILARKQAVNYSPGNNRNAQVQSKHLGKSVHALVTCSSLLLASSVACWASSWAACGDWSTKRYFVRLMCQIRPIDSSESPAGRL